MDFWRNAVCLLKDCLFPVFCFECQTEGKWWCEKCIKKYAITGVYYCPICHIDNNSGQPCNHCKVVSPLNGVAAFFNYNNHNVVGELIKQYKYNFAFDISSVWNMLIDLYLINIINKMNIDVNSLTIIPIPLHKRRERERGFNQADMIAKKIYRTLICERKVEFDNRNFLRKKYTQQQAKLSREYRLSNLKEAFVWCGKNPAPKNILLIDDVFTSGATMQECSRVLKKFGAQKVYGFTLARD